MDQKEIELEAYDAESKDFVRDPKGLAHDHVQATKDFLNRFKKLATVYIIDKIDDLRQIVNDLKIPYEEGHNIAMKTIERIEDRVNEALEKINEILTIWYVHKVLKRKNRFEPSDKNRCQLDLIKSLENAFRREYDSFVYGISSNFEEKLQSCDEQYVAVLRVVNYDKLFDDYVIKDVESFSQKFVKKIRSITGVLKMI